MHHSLIEVDLIAFHMFHVTKTTWEIFSYQNFMANSVERFLLPWMLQAPLVNQDGWKIDHVTPHKN